MVYLCFSTLNVPDEGPRGQEKEMIRADDDVAITYASGTEPTRLLVRSAGSRRMELSGIKASSHRSDEVSN